MVFGTLDFSRAAARRVALACSLVLMLQLSIRGASYSYVNIADSSMGFLSFTDSTGQRPDVNNNGTVTFYATTQTLGLTRGIYTGNGGPTALITGDRSPTVGLISTSSINDAGTVSLSTSQKVMMASGGTVVSIADRTGPLKWYFDSHINNHGAVAITAQRGSGNMGYAAYVIDGNVMTLIAEAGASGADSIYTQFTATDFNNAGHVAIYAFPGRPTSAAIYIGNGGALTFVAERDGSDTLSAPSINDADSVVYVAKSPPTYNQVGLYKYDAGVTTTLIAPSPSSGLSMASLPKINNQDMIAYLGYRSGHFGFMVGDGSTFSNVISVGDPLFGSTLKSIEPGYSLNDRGDIAFRYTLDSGRRGIALAVAVPEPGTIFFSAVGIAGLAAARSRARRSR